MHELNSVPPRCPEDEEKRNEDENEETKPMTIINTTPVHPPKQNQEIQNQILG